jgi:hypothetical protein
MSTGDGPADKKTRISFVVILFILLAAGGYLRHRTYSGGSPDSDLWKIGILVVIAILASIYVWWANKRDFK